MLTTSDLTTNQKNCIKFIDRGEDALIAADVGTGKTVIALTAAQNALKAGDVERWLVLAPLLVATDTWANEPQQWMHLRDISMSIATGTPKQREASLAAGSDIVVMNYENLQWLLDYYPLMRRHDVLPFDGIIFDEIDKLKCVSSKRFKALRNRIGVFRKRIGLTGTLVPNDLTEVWGQVYMVDGGQSFGRSYYKWRSDYFYPTDFNQYNWAPFPNTRERIIDKLSDLTFRIKGDDLPHVQIVNPDYIELPTKIRERYRKLERDFLLLVEENEKQHAVDAANAAVLAGKLQQITAGFSYVDDSKDVVWHSKAHFDWLEQQINVCLAADLQLMIFYHFNEERAELERRWPDMRFLAGGGSTADKRTTIGLWNTGQIPYIALHPASAGHGLNLQRSGAHHIAFLTMPWSGGLFRQAVGRLARRGQAAPVIFVRTALFKDTIDQRVFDTVTGRLTGMETFLDELEQAAGT